MLAVHIADGVLSDGWWIGGFVVAGLLAYLAARHIRDEEIAQVGLLTAVFFVASSFHVRLPYTSAHLLLSGLMGVVLGRRAPLAILVGVTLQAVLLQHGGYTTIGINTCVMTIPALLAWQAFVWLKRITWLKEWWFRGALVASCTLAWSFGAIYSVALLLSNSPAEFLNPGYLPETAWANHVTFHPITVCVIVGVAVLFAWMENRMNAPEFPLGLLIGEMAVLATTLLHCLVLRWGGGDRVASAAILVLFIIHLPVAAIEGIVVGFALGFLARVKPQLIGWMPLEKTKCSID